jgi:hypothetical protein
MSGSMLDENIIEHSSVFVNYVPIFYKERFCIFNKGLQFLDTS